MNGHVCCRRAVALSYIQYDTNYEAKIAVIARNERIRPTIGVCAANSRQHAMRHVRMISRRRWSSD